MKVKIQFLTLKSKSKYILLLFCSVILYSMTRVNQFNDLQRNTSVSMRNLTIKPTFLHFTPLFTPISTWNLTKNVHTQSFYVGNFNISNNNHSEMFVNIKDFTNTKEEIELTRNVVIMPNTCQTKSPISIYILSSVNAYKKRQILRQTWVSDAKRYNISVFFTIALTYNQTDQKLIEEEFQEYQDMIQFSFIDSYYNLTLKSVSILRWSEKYCKTKFVFKADDDIIVNIKLLLKYLHLFGPGIYGNMYDKVIPIQNHSNKWYMPKKVYGKKYYPKYTGGPAYIIAGFKVGDLVTGIDSYPHYYINMEDVFITGIMAEWVAIKRYQSKLFGVGCKTKCILKTKAIMTSCTTINQMVKRWLEMKQGINCTQHSTKRTKKFFTKRKNYKQMKVP